VIPEFDRNEVDRLASALKIRRPAARVLYARGYHDPETADRFLRPALEHLSDPMAMRDMDKAIDRLRRAVTGGQKILLYGDYDVDGTTSIVILKKAIELAGGQAGYHVPHRLRDGYGMRSDVIERAAAEGVALIISVDTGIRAAGVVRRAAELGIDVIITDHHLPEAELPPACATLNPNRPDCSYPAKNLCGVGVAFKLVQALLATQSWPDARRRRLEESFLKLVAIGTVADVVPLTGENRVMVKRGLEGLRSVTNPGLRALLEVAGFRPGEIPTAGQVAFRLAPRINAAGRMANAGDVVEMFLSSDEARARELAAALQSLNVERQQTEADMVREVLEECERAPITDSQAALVFSAEGWHRGVVGIVASRLVDRFHRPVFVLSEDAEENLAQGSGRSIPQFHLLEALESMSTLFTRFGGHRQAAGLSLPLSRIAEFRARLTAYAGDRLTPNDFRPQLELDAALELTELSDEAIAEVLSLAPFGFGNPAPVFAVCNAEVAGPPAVWKDRHLRLNLRQNGRTVTVKAWNFSDYLGHLGAGARIDAAITLEEDLFALGMGYPGWSVVLRNFRPAG
jgi:single-stranded-DNA-specific exonuclease